VQTRADVEAASRVLLRSLRKPLGRNADGVTAYFINRPISLRISQRIVDTPLTPNQVTTLALVIGLLASILVARGSWSALVFGGLALQLSSILDGVDGELARMRLTTSTSGEWYDTICDDVTNLAMMTGLGVACYVRTGAPQYVWGTWVGVGIGCLVAALFYRELVRAKIASHNDLKWGFESDDTRGGPLRHIAVWFSYLAKRDTYTLVLGVLLAFNLPQVAFWLMVVGTLLIFVGYVAHKVAAAWFGAPDIA
jgi:phosphatidylglycerophosphate synthase